MASKHLQQSGGAIGVSAAALFPQESGAPLWARGLVLPQAEISLSGASVTVGVAPTWGRPAARRKRARLGFGAFAVLAGGALLGLAGARGAARLRPTARASLAAAVVPAQRPFVSVALRATAPGVRFRFEDGREVTNPYVGLVPRDERPQVVWAEAPGFLPRRLPLTFGDDVTVDDILLVAGGAEPSVPAALPSPSRPKQEHAALLPTKPEHGAPLSPKPSSPKR